MYRDVDREIEELGVTCWTRGLCCDFDTVDHVLFASGLEVAAVRERHPGPFAPGSALCPFWKDRLCTLRDLRPLGCRTYFCDERFRPGLEGIYEKHYARLKEIAVRHRLPWSYRPFVAAMRAAE